MIEMMHDLNPILKRTSYITELGILQIFKINAIYLKQKLKMLLTNNAIKI